MATDEPPRCLCGHSAALHWDRWRCRAKKCYCPNYVASSPEPPCTCGHAAALHRTQWRCFDPICNCDLYVPDIPGLTHWVRWDIPGRRTARMRRAVCGVLVQRALWSPTPTCPVCREWAAEWEDIVSLE